VTVDGMFLWYEQTLHFKRISNFFPETAFLTALKMSSVVFWVFFFPQIFQWKFCMHCLPLHTCYIHHILLYWIILLLFGKKQFSPGSFHFILLGPNILLSTKSSSNWTCCALNFFVNAILICYCHSQMF